MIATVGFYKYGATIAATSTYLKKIAPWIMVHSGPAYGEHEGQIHLEIESTGGEVTTLALLGDAFAQGYDTAMYRFDK